MLPLDLSAMHCFPPPVTGIVRPSSLPSALLGWKLVVLETVCGIRIYWNAIKYYVKVQGYFVPLDGLANKDVRFAEYMSPMT